MTQPLQNNFPEYLDYVAKDDKEGLNKYLTEMNNFMKIYGTILANNIDGQYKSSYADTEENWTPTLAGASTAGTFTYTHQVGWVLRKNLMNDVWFDVGWTSIGTAAGNIYVELPYKVLVTDQMPFVGVVQHSNLTLTGFSDVVINGISDTFRGEFWKVGTGANTANLVATDLNATGRLIGFIRYIGLADERLDIT